MFCLKCGVETPDDSLFCRKCGKSLSLSSGTTSMAAAPSVMAMAKPRTARIPLFLGVLLLLAAVGWLVQHSNEQQRHRASTARTAESQVEPQDPPPPPQPVLHTVYVGQGALSIAPMHYSFYTLIVPAGAHGITVQGHFTATGGGRNDVEVFVLNADQFTNWKNGHQTPTYYNSGKVTVGDVEASLPEEAGAYYLVFNNNFSLLSGKAVLFKGTMTFYQ